MLANTYAAFKAAGVDDDQAQAAAEELAAFEGRFGSLDSGISRLDGRAASIEAKIDVLERKISTIEIRVTALEGRVSTIENKIAAIEGKLTVLMWAMGVNAAATIAILGVLLRHG